MTREEAATEEGPWARSGGLWTDWPEAPVPAARRVVIGGLSALAALSAATFAAAVLPHGESPESGIAKQLISAAPAQLRESAIALLGTRDKPAIVLVTLVLPAAIGAILGLAARRTRVPLAAGIAALMVVVVTMTVASSPASALVAVVGGILAIVAGLATLAFLSRPVDASNDRDYGPALSGDAGEDTLQADRYSRRHFIKASAAVGAAVLLLGAASSVIAQSMQTSVEALRRAIRLPRATRPLPPASVATSFDVPGLSPLITPNSDFYRIDIALDVPQVDPATWRLDVTGMVRQAFSLSYRQLMAMPQVEVDITLCCVSDEVGGNLISSARWQGVRLADLLARAGVSPKAQQVVGISVDGFSAGFPIAAVLDGRDAIVAVGMNGEPLPLEHGFPARLVVPGLYGYVSATKWLTQIVLTTFASGPGFWVDRGWDPAGPIRTESRIDVPRDGVRISSGDAVIAGVAWAQHRGIKGVEVRVDGQEWQAAEVADALSLDTWRQWRLRWHATAGEHTIEVRATDATDTPQTPKRVDPFPAGATGYHAITVTAR